MQDYTLPAETGYESLDGIWVSKGQTYQQAKAEREQHMLWRTQYGGSEHGGWVTDPVDGIYKPMRAHIKQEVA